MQTQQPAKPRNADCRRKPPGTPRVQDRLQACLPTDRLRNVARGIRRERPAQNLHHFTILETLERRQLRLARPQLRRNRRTLRAMDRSPSTRQRHLQLGTPVRLWPSLCRESARHRRTPTDRRGPRLPQRSGANSSAPVVAKACVDSSRGLAKRTSAAQTPLQLLPLVQHRHLLRPRHVLPGALQRYRCTRPILVVIEIPMSVLA